MTSFDSSRVISAFDGLVEHLQSIELPPFETFQVSATVLPVLKTLFEQYADQHSRTKKDIASLRSAWTCLAPGPPQQLTQQHANGDRLESQTLLQTGLLASNSKVGPMSSIRADASAARMSSVHSEIEAAFIQQLTDRHAVAKDIHNENAPRVFTFQPTPSNVNAAAHGTVHRIPNGLTRSMEEEFKGSAFEKDYNYVVYGKACDTPESKWESRQNCIRDEGHEGWTLQDFMTRPETKRVRDAGLTMAEVAMLRLYPTFAWTLNAILRQQEKSLEPWATSISILTSAIIKLSAKSPLHPVYRAISNAVVDGGVADGLHSCGLVLFDDAFSSVTQKVETLLKYAGDPDTPAIVLCIEPSWSCRVAALRELSQYPQEEEDLLPPCTSLEITRVITVGRKKLLQCTPHLCAMRHYTHNLLFPWSSPNDPLTAEELNELCDLWKKKSQRPMTDDENVKYSSNARDFILGEPIIAALGLEDYMRQGFSHYWVHPNSCDEALAAIDEEFRAHGTDEDREWFDYIRNHAASEKKCHQGIRDHNRDPIMLADFLKSKEAKIARLNLAHVLALRLYSSPVFRSLNIPLRTYKCDADGQVEKPPQMKAPHSFPITVFYIREAISKLRAVESDLGTQNAFQVMWRGNSNMIVSEDYLSRGGVETGITSTTLELETAVQYCFSERPVIFKIITRSFMERGAYLDWLSVFPDERECCFPPLTFFSPTGRHQTIKHMEGCSMTVIEFTPRL